MTHMTRSAPTTVESGEIEFWRDRTHISLQPVAAPSILGLFGFAGATFIVATNMAGWYGSATTPAYLFPFAAMFGGLAQLLAGMWAYRARDAVATAMHGTWGSFWLGYGLLYLLLATGALPGPAPASALGYWFIALAAITWSGTLAAMGENIGLGLVLLTLAAGSTCEAIGMLARISAWRTTGAWLLIVSAALAWYVATAMMLESAYKRVVLPMGKIGGDNVPGHAPRHMIQFQAGEPGVKVGQ
jgi:succinate-acetate transporter protein